MKVPPKQAEGIWQMLRKWRRKFHAECPSSEPRKIDVPEPATPEGRDAVEFIEEFKGKLAKYIDAPWKSDRETDARDELLARLPRMRLIIRAAGLSAAAVEQLFRAPFPKIAPEMHGALDVLEQVSGAHRYGVVAALTVVEPAGPASMPPLMEDVGRSRATWRERVEAHPLAYAFVLLVAGFSAGFLARESLDHWLK